MNNNKLVLIAKNPAKKNAPVGLYKSARDKLNEVMRIMGTTNATQVASMMIEYAYANIEWETSDAE